MREQLICRISPNEVVKMGPPRKEGGEGYDPVITRPITFVGDTETYYAIPFDQIASELQDCIRNLSPSHFNKAVNDRGI